MSIVLQDSDVKKLSGTLSDADNAAIVNSVIHGRSTAGGGEFVDVKVNPSGALAVSIGDSALPDGAATETSVATMVLLLNAMLEKMPRSTANDQAAISIESIASNLTLATVSNVSNISQLGGQEALTAVRTQMIPLYIYNNIIVS